MPKTTPRAARSKSKPVKPYPGFPLFPHANGLWAKKIRGKLHYFGPWKDAQAALDLYLEQRDDLHAGRRPRQFGDGFTVRDLANHFLTSKQRQVDADEIKLKTFSDYHGVAARIIEVFGPDRLVSDLRPDDFGELRAVIARNRGPVATAGQIVQSKMLFTHAFANELIDRPVAYGSQFSRPPQKALRAARNRPEKSRMFEPTEIKALISGASVPMQAMIYLGLNAGFGNTDVAELPISAIDFEAGVIDFPRPKTAISRRCPLWPETIEALRAAIEARPAPISPADQGLVFVTKPGHRWVRVRRKASPGKGQAVATLIDAVGQEFSKLRRAQADDRLGRGFYSLRHTFRTVVDELPDRPAVDRIMGHESTADMRVAYVERIDDGRLRAVTVHVRRWFLATAGK